MSQSDPRPVDLVAAIGAGTLRDMLRWYEPQQRRWHFTMDSDFWRAVGQAHAEGIRGAGVRVAVIDGGFDTAVPGLEGLPLLGENPADPDRCLHGTIVALLLRAVAPDAAVELHPVADAEGIDGERLLGAYRGATERGAQIISVSIGDSHEVDLGAAVQRVLQQAEPWPDATAGEAIFAMFGAFARVERWSDFLSVPETPVVTAVRAARAAGIAIIAAAGNARVEFTTPAADEAAVSAGFLREQRSAEPGGPEVVVAADPRWYQQTQFVDFMLVQPPELSGTSCAAPLLAGAAALTGHPLDLYALRRAAKLGAIASELVALHRGSQWTPRQLALVHELYGAAMDASPHRHAGTGGPCLTCALWHVQVMIDYGFFQLERGDLDDARLLLECAVRVAPGNPHALGNLGMVRARLAAAAVDAGRIDEAGALLRQAAECYAASTRIRRASPALAVDAEDYARRWAEFAQGSADPALWRAGFRAHDEHDPVPSERAEA